MNVRVVLLTLIAVGLTACAPHEPAGNALDRVRAAGVLRWGGDEQGGEPYAFEDPAHPGTLIGFETELAAALAHALGVRAMFVQNDWPTLIPSLERGTFDVAMNGIEVTPARLGRVDFSRPYFFFTLRLVGRAGDGRITDLASLRGLRVGTLAGTQAWQTLLDAGARAIPYEGVDEPFIDLEQGRTDAVLLDDIIVDRYAPRHPTLRLAGDVGAGTYAVAVRREDGALRTVLDGALGNLIASGELRRILARWHIDGPRQAALATAPASGAARGGEVLAPPFGARHLWLFLQGALVTLLVSVGAMALAVSFGLALALARLYLPRAGRLAGLYIELFRGTPVLLQLYLLYYGLAPVLRLDAFGAAILGLGLNYAAYEAEIHRAAIASVPPGQLEAALSLGMSRALALRRIVLPQALRVALPGVTNDFIALLKDSSLVSVITVVELTKRMSITAVDTHGWLLPGLACAGFYFAMSYPLARLARHWERRLGG
jgi:polar amino acid transport system substrate-binding protein